MADDGLSATELRAAIRAMERGLARADFRISYRDDEGQAVTREFRSVEELERALSYLRGRLRALEGQGTGGMSVRSVGIHRG
ncbi:MAG: hypothetical protein AAF713_20635 [Pseudomonadota bacterium]